MEQHERFEWDATSSENSNGRVSAAEEVYEHELGLSEDSRPVGNVSSYLWISGRVGPADELENAIFVSTCTKLGCIGLDSLDIVLGIRRSVKGRYTNDISDPQRHDSKCFPS